MENGCQHAAAVEIFPVKKNSLKFFTGKFALNLLVCTAGRSGSFASDCFAGANLKLRDNVQSIYLNKTFRTFKWTHAIIGKENIV